MVLLTLTYRNDHLRFAVPVMLNCLFLDILLSRILAKILPKALKLPNMITILLVLIRNTIILRLL